MASINKYVSATHKALDKYISINKTFLGVHTFQITSRAHMIYLIARTLLYTTIYNPSSLIGSFLFIKALMKSLALTFPNDAIKKKRDYSRKGCRECKRRKIKCDEGKPSCWQCHRLMKECSYPGIGEKVPRISKRRMLQLGVRDMESTETEDKTDMIQTRNISTGNFDEPKKNGNSNEGKFIEVDSRDNVMDKINHDVFGPEEALLGPSKSSAYRLRDSSGPSMEMSSSDNCIDIRRFGVLAEANVSGDNSAENFAGNMPIDLNADDLNVLVSDLNGLVNNIMDVSNFGKSDDFSSDSWSDFFTVQKALKLDSLVSGRDASPIHTEDEILKNIPLDYIKTTKSLEKMYLSEFYNDFSSIILPIPAYDKELGSYFNPARDILLQRASQAPFLLAAILAQGAKTSSQKNNLPEDEEAYCMYLAKCLKLLEPAILTTLKNNDRNMICSNIETVLLTVLLLTSSNAANESQDWRPHLKGAREILLKNSSDRSGQSKFKNSKILIFCKFWFISIEVLAGLSSKFGGSLRTSKEIDTFITPGNDHELEVLREMGLVFGNGYNLLYGYHNLCVITLRDLIKLLNRIRNGKYDIDNGLAFESIRLLHEFYKQLNIEFFDFENSKEYTSFSENRPEKSITNYQNKTEGHESYIRWINNSHQSYILASVISIFTKGLSMQFNSPPVQEITTKLIKLISFLKSAQDTSASHNAALLIIQWPIFIAGVNACSEDHKFLIMKFFRLTSQMGSGSAAFALKILNRIWRKQAFNSDRETNDSIEDVDVDIMIY